LYAPCFLRLDMVAALPLFAFRYSPFARKLREKSGEQRIAKGE